MDIYCPICLESFHERGCWRGFPPHTERGGAGGGFPLTLKARWITKYFGCRRINRFIVCYHIEKISNRIIK